MTYQTPGTMDELRQWVTGGTPLPKDANNVVLTVTHNLLAQQFPELKIDKRTRIGEIKERLEKRTGTSARYMSLVLYSSYDENKGALDDSSRTLAEYGAEDSDRIHIIDNDPNSLAKDGGLEDVNQVVKYELTREEYMKRESAIPNVRKKMMETKPELREKFEKLEERRKEKDDRYKSESVVEGIKVGDRCQVTTANMVGKSFFVRWVGEAPHLGLGYYVGLECFDELEGGHDGLVKGVKLYECAAKKGKIFRPDVVRVNNSLKTDEEELGLSDEL